MDLEHDNPQKPLPFFELYNRQKSEKMLAFVGAICYNKHVKRYKKKPDSDPKTKPQ